MGQHSDFRISSFQVVDAWRILQCTRKTEKILLRVSLFLGTQSQNYRRLYGSLTVFQESYLHPFSTLEHQTWSNTQSQHELLYDGVSLSISLNLKPAPVPYATPKWPIMVSSSWSWSWWWWWSSSSSTTSTSQLLFIAQNEWTSLIIHDRRRSKFNCTRALNKLRLWEQGAFFGPPALITLIGATSLAPKLQIYWENIENEWFIYGLSAKDKNFTQQKYYPSSSSSSLPMRKYEVWWLLQIATEHSTIIATYVC